MRQTEARMILKDAPIMWRRINSIGVILDCNSTYAASLGYAKSEILGRSIFKHVPKESWHDMNDSLKTWFETGTVKDIRITFQRRDGSTFPGLLQATSLYDANDRLLGSNTAIFDMTRMAESDIEKYEGFFDEASRRLDRIRQEQYDGLDDSSRSEYDGLREMFDMLLSLKLDRLE